MFFLFQGPTGLAITPQSETSLKVSFVAPTGSPSGTVYRASTDGHSCEVSADASDLSCLLTGLSSGKKYTVQAVGCEGSTKCSDPISGVAYTTPEGR